MAFKQHFVFFWFLAACVGLLSPLCCANSSAFGQQVSPLRLHLCDLNGDGRSTREDVELAVAQVTGGSEACSTADINGDGICDVVDIHRLTQAAIGHGCWAAESSAVVIRPGEYIQAIVDAHPSGTAFLLQEGIHRMQEIRPKNGNTFVGEPGAVLNGAKLLTNFTRAGQHWMAVGQFQQNQVHGNCMTLNGVPYEACRYAEDLFVDNVPFWQVTSRDELAPGAWYFDYDKDVIFMADNPAGRTVEVSVRRHAFAGSAENVTIRGLVIEKYAVPAQYGAIHGVSPDGQTLSRGWVVERNEIRFNHGLGVKIGHEWQVLGNHIHTNGQLGVGGTGDDTLMEGNVITSNNYAGFATGWEAGGAKFVRTKNLVVRRNLVADNNGRGLWTDIDNLDTTYEDNRVVRNRNSGIAHELSYDARIRNNSVACNGTGYDEWLWGAQILIQNSRNAEVTGNRVVVCAGAGDGIALVQQERGTGAHGPWVTIGNYVHHNHVTFLGEVGYTGAAADYDSEGMYGGNNRFDHNTYQLPGPNSVRWTWRGVKPWSAFRSQGQEQNGKLEQ